ncbi:MAG: Phosphoenolpyruvate carboxykinase [Bacillales bacterium]|nr:Phosphoenolpyruvate carboxykinase [Bacillales bacterium]
MCYTNEVFIILKKVVITLRLTVPTEMQELLNGKNVHLQLSVPQLVEKVLDRKEGVLTDTGAIRVATGKYTGRSPKDKYTVEESLTKDKIDWGNVNRPISPENFDKLYNKVIDQLKKQDEIFVFNGFAGADLDYRLPIRVVNEYAWHNLFVHQLFIRPTEEELSNHQAEFTILGCPSVKAIPGEDGTDSDTFICVSFERKCIIIGGSEYSGEMKKSIFSIMNYLLPEQGVLSMHCSANVGAKGDVALFFGLSGTGKTTLSADKNRSLIGDDEHGWSDNGVFNIEGGCYAKCINLSQEKEPEIWNAIKFGSVVENVVYDEHTRVPNYDDGSITENTRVAYPIDYIENVTLPSKAGHPNTIVFLTADAYGVLPPISKLTKEQAMYHFLSGFTSKLAGTERGITTPQSTFSTCFGSPFLPLHATRYANLLGEKIDKHGRLMVNAAVEGLLDQVETVTNEIFGLQVPVSVPGVPGNVLQPELTWSNVDDYKKQALDLAQQFKNNFKKFGMVSSDIEELGGPKI